MATVKINCPQCAATGLIGSTFATVCPQCIGTGTVSADDTRTLAAVNTTIATAPSSVAVVVTVPTAVPKAAARVISKGKDN